MKKLVWILGSLLLILVAAAIIVPLVVDVDKYRPQIVQAANEKINGKLELGKLSLSLWGQIKVEVAGVNLKDSRGRDVLAVKDAFFHVPFSSIFGGAPLLTFKMQKPELKVVKDKSTGKLNVMTLVKSEEATPAPTQPQAHPAPGVPAPAAPVTKAEPAPTAKSAPTSASSHTVTLPTIATRARLGIEMRDAQLVYLDETTGVDSKTSNLNFLVKDLSLSRPTELELWADLDTKAGKEMTVRGPVKVTAKSEVQVSGGAFQSLTLQFNGDFDGLEINSGNMFMKKKGMAAHLDGLIKASQQELRIEKLETQFFNANIKTTGTVSNLGAASAPVAQIAIRSNPIELKAWSELIPMLTEYQLAGVMTLGADANGPTDKLSYKADLAVNGLTAKSPQLKTEPRFDVAVKVVTDQIEHMSLTMKAPGNDLRVTGKMVSFTKPRLDLQVASSGMDLDQLVVYPEKKNSSLEQPRNKKFALVNQAFAAPAETAPADYDAMLDSLRTNPIMAAMVANVDVNMKSLQSKGVKMTDITSKIKFADLIASIESFKMGLFGGTVQMNASSALRPKAPTYRFNAQVANLDLQQAVKSQMELFKNTLIGKAMFKIDGSGASFNPTPAKNNLNAKGNFKVDQAKFASIDVGKMVNEALGKALDKIGDKIPGLKGKKIGMPNRESKYEYISSSFSIGGGKFSMPDFVAKAMPNDGIDLKGSTTVGMVDMGLNARWEVIDTYNFTHAKDLSVNQAGVNVDHILAEGNGPVKFPITVNGTATAPQYSYAEVPEYLGKVALNNVSQAVTGRAKAEAKKKIDEQTQGLLKNAPAPAKKAVEGITKKLFGR